MRILLCADPLAPGAPDPSFETEIEAIDAAGIPRDLLDLESLLGGATGRALRRVGQEDLGLVVYRGWMLPVDRYASLSAAIEERGGKLINDAAQYQLTHELPGWYPVLGGHTPKTLWLPGEPPFAAAKVRAALEAFADGPVIVKDFVKSRKHEWAEACFIPVASDFDAAERVVQIFVKRQAEDFAGGLVFREFVALEEVGRHRQSGLGLGREYRLFFLDGHLLAAGRYWDEGPYSDEFPTDSFVDLASSIQSRFFAMDIARTAAGEWIVIELGDGQVSGLPSTIDPGEFYRSFVQALPVDETTGLDVSSVH